MRTVRVFLSSPFRAHDEDFEELGLLEFRKQLKADAAKRNIELILAEESVAGSANHIGIVSACSGLIQDADAFVAIIFQRHGSPLAFANADQIDLIGDVSIFETEMLVAAMKAKPTLVIRVQGFIPHPRLSAFLKLVSTTPTIQASCEQTEILDCIADWLKPDISSHDRNRRGLFDFLLQIRRAKSVKREVIKPELLFLEGIGALSTKGETNLDVVSSAIKAARKGVAENGTPIQETVRLALLWTAFRELFKENSREAIREHAEIWRDGLGAWASRAAWAGLKGPFQLGELAAVNMNYWIMAQLDLGGALPYGARASALLGVVDYSHDRKERVRLLNTAHALCDKHIRSHEDNPSGALLIRGAVNRRLAIEGRPWRVWSALSDYRTAITVRERIAAPASSVGAAMVELGLTQSAIVRRWGLALMKEGVALMEADGEDLRGKVGFVVRAKEKYALALRRAGRLDEAGSQEAGAGRLSAEFGMRR